jgi:hypothetical protein
LPWTSMFLASTSGAANAIWSYHIRLRRARRNGHPKQSYCRTFCWAWAGLSTATLLTQILAIAEGFPPAPSPALSPPS